MLIKPNNITLVSLLMTRDGATGQRCRALSGSDQGVEIAIGFVWSHKTSLGLVGVRDRGAIDAHTPRCDGAMVEHSERLLAPFQSATSHGAHPVSDRRQKYPQSGCVFENSPPAKCNRVHAETASQEPTEDKHPVRHDDKKIFFPEFSANYSKKILSIIK